MGLEIMIFEVKENEKQVEATIKPPRQKQIAVCDRGSFLKAWFSSIVI
jgi:ASC-1-like (ASCH) protein